MTYKVIKNKDGKYETIDGPDETVIKQNLEKLHKEARDMIEGNTQFHDDPYKAEKKVDHEHLDGVYGW